MSRTTELTDTVLGIVKSGQDLVLDSVKNWVGAVDSVVPAAPYGDELSDRATAAVDSAYTFAERLLAQQHAFTSELLASVRPLVAKEEQPKAKPRVSTAA